MLLSAELTFKQLKAVNCDHFATIKCSAGKLWVLAFIWMPLDTHHNITGEKVHPIKVTVLLTSLITVVPSAGQYGKYTRTHWEKLLKNGQRNLTEFKAFGHTPNSPDPDLVEHPCDVLEQVQYISGDFCKMGST